MIEGLAAPAVAGGAPNVVAAQSVREDPEHEVAGEEENHAGRVDRIVEANSLQHLMTHLPPKNPL